MIFNCKTCNKEINRRPSEIAKSKTGNFFCCRTCTASWNNTQDWRVRENHPNWKNGKSSYRTLALGTFGFKCANNDCELTKAGIIMDKSEMFDVDHINGNRDNNDITNLQVLCVWCHVKKTRNW